MDNSVERGGSEVESEPRRGAGPPFQLRFAPRRQLGRSCVSSVKPMGLPAILKDKLNERGVEAVPEGREGLEGAALRRVTELYRRGPREKYSQPLTTAHQYGWWWDCSFGESHHADCRFQHHIQDSAWMKEQLRVLASDASYKRF